VTSIAYFIVYLIVDILDTRMEMGRWQEQKFGDMRRIQEGMEAPE